MDVPHIFGAYQTSVYARSLVLKAECLEVVISEGSAYPLPTRCGVVGVRYVVSTFEY